MPFQQPSWVGSAHRADQHAGEALNGKEEDPTQVCEGGCQRQGGGWRGCVAGCTLPRAAGQGPPLSQGGAREGQEALQWHSGWW